MAADITKERHAKEPACAEDNYRNAGMTSKKRSRLDRQLWQDLRPELLEKIFSKVDGPDRHRARLVCRAFRDAASRSVKLLVIGSKHDGERHEQAESDFIEQQVEKLPGLLECVSTVKLDYCQAHLPAITPKLLHMTALVRLDITGGDCALTRPMIEAICTLTWLDFVSIQECTIEDTGAFESLNRLHRLRGLQVTKCCPQDINMMEAIGKLTGLTQLALTKPFCFKDEGYSALANLSNLQRLRLGWSWRLGGSRESLEFLSGMRDLRHLSFAKCFISDADLRWVSSLQRLEVLEVCLCHNVSGAVFGTLRGLRDLREVILEGSNMISDEGVCRLAGLTSLQRLYLGYSRLLTPAAFDSLVQLPNLRSLFVPETLFSAPTTSFQEEMLPKLQQYGCSPTRGLRIPGRIEEHFQELLRENIQVMTDPSISSRVLQWFQRRVDTFQDPQ